jgi:hypothetical protein
MLSFRLFPEQDTLGALNLYSTRPAAFGRDSRAAGEVFAARAALALRAAREHDRIQGMTAQLHASRRQAGCRCHVDVTSVGRSRGSWQASIDNVTVSDL